MYVRNACAIYLCSLLGEACEIVSDAPKCIYNLRFRWWCRRVCKYVTGICYQGNRHSVNRCNGMAGAVLLARSSFHSDSTSQLHMQEFLCVFVCVCVVACVWIRCELECSLAFLTIYALLCNISHFFIFAIAVFWFKSHMCFSASLGCFTALFPHLSPYSHPFICLSLPPQASRPPFFFSYLALSLSAEAHQGKQMPWLLFMFPLGLAFIQIIHRPCTVQKLGLNGIHWQLSLLYPRSHT